MSFRMVNTSTKTSDHKPPKDDEQKSTKTFPCTQVDIDLIDQQYKEKEELYKKMLSEPTKGLLEQYKKNLVKETTFEQETIIYDKNTGRWKIEKVSNNSN